MKKENKLVIDLGNINFSEKQMEALQKALHKTVAQKVKKAKTALPADICEGIDDIDICEKAGGIANLVIDESEALLMKARFINDYRRDDSKNPINAMDSIYWIDKQVWFDIAKYLATTLDSSGKPVFDGIRIYMSCDLVPDTFPGQQYVHKSGVYIFPTTYQYTPDLKQTDHKDSLVKITLSGGKTSPYIQDSSFANPRIRKFNEIYRRMSMPVSKQKDNFSKSMWIDSCVVSTMAKLLRLPNAQLDGVNLNLAAYLKFEPKKVPSMLYANQSTILLVPSSFARGNHINNWTIINCLNDKITPLKYPPPPPPGGLNHGELCPQVCN